MIQKQHHIVLHIALCTYDSMIHTFTQVMKQSSLVSRLVICRAAAKGMILSIWL